MSTQELRPDKNLGQGGLLSVPIYDITPFTMQDYPDLTACIIWLAGCNMRCAYCHNPDIIKSKGRYDLEHLFRFLEKRQDLLDAVVLSGGEATLFPDIIDFAQQIKKMGYKIKLDTNGTRPKIIKTLVEKGLVDFIALDYKAPKEKYVEISHHKYFDHFHETLKFLCQTNSVTFEIRTTIHTSLLSEKDILSIMDDLDAQSYSHTYYIQNYHMADGAQSLSSLPMQENLCDVNLLQQQSRAFSIEFRNFT